MVRSKEFAGSRIAALYAVSGLTSASGFDRYHRAGRIEQDHPG